MGVLHLPVLGSHDETGKPPFFSLLLLALEIGLFLTTGRHGVE